MAKATAPCANIKAAGITIYTIQVNIDGDLTSRLLQNSASDSSNFWMPTASSQINTAFNQIGTNLSQLRVAKWTFPARTSRRQTAILRFRNEHILRSLVIRSAVKATRTLRDPQRGISGRLSQQSRRRSFSTRDGGQREHPEKDATEH